MPTFGEIEGYPEGSLFGDREELRASGLHPPPVAGISGPEREGAESVVLNEGYEDDEDHGDVVIYTGQGGRDPNTGMQIADQELRRGNLALVTSELKGLPVRVVRGPKLKSRFAPDEGYRYDGLYRVESHEHIPGKSGFKIFRYRLVRDDRAKPPAKPIAGGREEPPRVETTVTRVIRDTALTRRIKEVYDYRCQVCGMQLMCEGGPYAEAAHIVPLGRPHDGPDTVDNILCLCPNHHVQFDKGGFTINDDLTLNEIDGRLTIHPDHTVNLDHVQHHRMRFAR